MANTAQFSMEQFSPQLVLFLEHLKKSRALDETQMAEAASLATEAAHPKNLAISLVQRKILTRWQAEQLLAGHHAFFLGKYCLLEKIGEGGMGTVFKATQGMTGRIVALKVLSQKVLKKPEAVDRFLREVRVAAALNHPHIVTAFDADCVGKNYFLVMEYVHGKDLGVWIKELGKLPIHWACECIRQAALGLQHAHEQGLVHRDIKPGNLLVVAKDVESEPHVKILDMGLARFSEVGDEIEITQTGHIMGTPEYIAPEQAKNTKAADIRADIFSLGCSLFKMLTGKSAYEGDTAMEQIAARFAGKARRLTEIDSETPPELDLIIEKATKQKPDDRYQAPIEIANALQAFLEGKTQTGRNTIGLPILKSEPAPAQESAANLDSVTSQKDSAMNQFITQLRIDEGASTTGVVKSEPAPPISETIIRPSLLIQPSKSPHTTSKWAALVAGVLALAGLLWAAFQVTVKTPSGTIYVEVDQPGAQVSVDDGKITLTSPTLREPVEIDVPDGQHTLRVRKEGFVLHTTEFTLTDQQKKKHFRTT